VCLPCMLFAQPRTNICLSARLLAASLLRSTRPLGQSVHPCKAKHACRVPVDRAAKRALGPVLEPTVSEKRCASCGITKPASAFHRHPQMRTGLGSHCKACRRTKAKDKQVRLSVWQPHPPCPSVPSARQLVCLSMEPHLPTVLGWGGRGVPAGFKVFGWRIRMLAASAGAPAGFRVRVFGLRIRSLAASAGAPACLLRSARRARRVWRTEPNPCPCNCSCMRGRRQSRRPCPSPPPGAR
jgi:hypothetical protein